MNSDLLRTLTVDSEVIWKLVGITYSMVKHLPFSSPGRDGEGEGALISFALYFSCEVDSHLNTASQHDAHPQPVVSTLPAAGMCMRNTQH